MTGLSNVNCGKTWAKNMSNPAWEAPISCFLFHKEHFLTKSDFLIPMAAFCRVKMSRPCLIERHLTLQVHLPCYCHELWLHELHDLPSILSISVLLPMLFLFSLTCIYYPSFQKRLNVALFIPAEFYSSLRIYQFPYLSSRKWISELP